MKCKACGYEDIDNLVSTNKSLSDILDDSIKCGRFIVMGGLDDKGKTRRVYKCPKCGITRFEPKEG